MKALSIDGAIPESLRIDTYDVPTPGDHEVVIRVHAAALNHRDYYIYRGWSPAKSWSRFIIGSDASGVITSTGKDITDWQVGDAVIVNPLLTCGTCHICLSNQSEFCSSAHVLGGPTNGTISEYIKIDSRYLIRKPEYLTHEEAAALPLALGTAWRALHTVGKLQPNETVLLQGIGGGVALFGLQIAHALGSHAIVTSSSDEKLEKAIALGAKTGFNYKKVDVLEEVQRAIVEGVDLSLDSGGKETLRNSVESLRNGGRVVAVGSTTGNPAEYNLFYGLADKTASLAWAGMASTTQLEEAVLFFETHKIHPMIHQSYSLDDVQSAIQEMERADQFGKLVIKLL